ncbi:hypothetical protein BDY24DRAFT_402521 [Mrakia frigida]|uniref:Vps71p n=1 Tax=Mrakia frigida TaxID=29902 RepID=UPI003FCC19CD
MKSARSQPVRQAAVSAAQLNASIFSGVELSAARASSKGGIEAGKKRLKRKLDDLERTNYTDPSTIQSSIHDDIPLPVTASSSAAPSRHRSSGKKPTPAVRTLLTPQYRKTLAALLDEHPYDPYLTSVALPPVPPPRKLCLPCGYVGAYACGKCGEWVCSKSCWELHDESGCDRRGG